MAQPTARERALLRIAMADEVRDLREGMMNLSGGIGGEYPRMMYRATDMEDVHVVSTDREGRPRETVTLNRFGGLLCDTCIAEDADEAERLSGEGWDTTPQAAHGQASGMAAVTSAKDDEIAALRAELAALRAEPPARRGPGRPPKIQEPEAV